MLIIKSIVLRVTTLISLLTMTFYIVCQHFLRIFIYFEIVRNSKFKIMFVTLNLNITSFISFLQHRKTQLANSTIIHSSWSLDSYSFTAMVNRISCFYLCSKHFFLSFIITQTKRFLTMKQHASTLQIYFILNII